MPLENAQFIGQLVPTNPNGDTDPKAQGDDHLRLLKQVLQNQFPNLGATAVQVTAQEINLLNGLTVPVTSLQQMVFNTQAAPYTLVNADNGKYIDITTAGTVTLGALEAGFCCLLSNVSGGAVTLSASSGSLRWMNANGGAPPTGNRVLTSAGIATVYRDSQGNWRVFGAGIS